MIEIEVDNRSGVDVDEDRACELARRVLAAEGVDAGELGLVFVGPDESRSLKHEHLGIDEATDALAFPIDALYDTMDPEKLNAFIERGTIEVAPLAFMRGRTLNDSFIILDEAQNTSPEQMQMFLTRLGFGSKVVITGDVTQVDLPRDQASGLIQVQSILDGIDDIAFIRFGFQDVVRHKLVQKIVEAYREHAEETGSARSK